MNFNFRKIGKIPLPDLLLLLKEKAPDLFNEIQPRTHGGTARWEGTNSVHISVALAQKIDNWLVDNWLVSQETSQPPQPPITWTSKEQEAYVKRWAAAKAGKPLPPPPAPVVAQPAPAPYKDDFNERMAALAESERERIRSQRAAATVVTPPPPPPQPVRLLPNGEPELPLDASQFQMRRASVDQLRDLDARRRASKPHSSGWHGAKF